MKQQDVVVKRPILSLKSKIDTAFLGLKPTQTNSRQATRALNTNSKAWKYRREQALRRDMYKCRGFPLGQHADGCNGFATEVDHIDGNSSNDAADGSNYQSLSKQCHSRKTMKELSGG